MYTCIHIACGLKSSMCDSVRSFWTYLFVTVGTVVLIVRLLLLVCSDDMGGTLYGVNTVVVVGLIQFVVLMNEAFPFDSMLCHGIHYFLH